MSTLGRKAIRRTLERSKKEALKDVDIYIAARQKPDKMANVVYRANMAISSLISYIMSLEDYNLELDEAWDKLLKSAEQAQKGKPKPVLEKGEAKKTSYIK